MKHSITIEGYRLTVLLLTACFGLLLFASPAQAGIITNVPSYLGLSRGLVGCWTFNGSYTKAPDCSGNNNTGTLNNGPTKIQGKIGQALGFDGVNDNVSVPSLGLPYGASPRTISFWMKVVNDTGIRPVFGYGTATNNDLFEILLDSQHIVLHWHGNNGPLTWPNTFSKFNQWQHVVFSYDGTVTRSYVDSVNFDNVTHTLSTIDSGAANIGTGIYYSTDYYGSLDDIRIYNRALSANEVSRLYRIGLGSTANRGASASPLDRGLVGHWTFDGPDISGTRAKDRSGNNNHGTLNGGASLKPIAGKVGQALTFDGVDDVVVIPTSTTFDVTFMTICAWVKPSIHGSSRYVAARSTGPSTSTNMWRFGLFGSSNIWRFQVVTAAGGGLADSPTSATAGVWQHACGTLDGSNVRLYVNAAQIAQGAFTGSLSAISQDLYIGNRGGLVSGESFFDGPIDEVRFYNRALSVGEIARLYNQTQGRFNSSQTPNSMDRGLVGHWTFDGPDISGTRAKDRSGLGDHGTLTNSPTKVAGKVGQGLSFDGVNDTVTVSAVDLSGTNKVSVSFWLYKTYFKSSVGGETELELTTNFNSFTTGFGLFINPGGGCASKNIGITLKGDVGLNIACYTSPSANMWHHYVAIYDKSQGTNEVDLYIDGVFQSATARPLTNNNTNNFGSEPFYMMSRGNASEWNPGQVDDVRIYNRVLSAGEIQKLYNMGR